MVMSRIVFVGETGSFAKTPEDSVKHVSLKGLSPHTIRDLLLCRLHERRCECFELCSRQVRW